MAGIPRKERDRRFRENYKAAQINQIEIASQRYKIKLQSSLTYENEILQWHDHYRKELETYTLTQLSNHNEAVKISWHKLNPVEGSCEVMINGEWKRLDS